MVLTHVSRIGYPAQACRYLISCSVLGNSQAINSAYELPRTKQLIRYLHACAGYPTRETWVKAIRAGNYVSWPGLTVKKVNKFYPETDETPKGHMRQTRQGVRSTKEKVEVREKNNVAVQRTKQKDLYVCVDQVKDTIYTF